VKEFLGCINRPDKIEKALLFVYFEEDSLSAYETYFEKFIKEGTLAASNANFKKLAVVACYNNALLMLHELALPDKTYLFLRAYLEFKTMKEPKDTAELKEIAGILDPLLLAIVKAWEIMYCITQISLSSDFQSILQLQLEL
jgi:hypothetical protein